MPGRYSSTEFLFTLRRDSSTEFFTLGKDISTELFREGFKESSDTKPDEQSREGYRECCYSVRMVTKLIVQIRKRFRDIQMN